MDAAKQQAAAAARAAAQARVSRSVQMMEADNQMMARTGSGGVEEPPDLMDGK